ncbi:hypothetical protein BKA81DRAFT_382441 [Phyllosticta paracitricarpa]|uniref:Uncharacterized protein n=1 Tax=Phyllosticta citricarpa TaxID=55181 RepID=A0ABR1LS28_9PEZI
MPATLRHSKPGVGENELKAYIADVVDSLGSKMTIWPVEKELHSPNLAVNSSHSRLPVSFQAHIFFILAGRDVWAYSDQRNRLPHEKVFINQCPNAWLSLSSALYSEPLSGLYSLFHLLWPRLLSLSLPPFATPSGNAYRSSSSSVRQRTWDHPCPDIQRARIHQQHISPEQLAKPHLIPGSLVNTVVYSPPPSSPPYLSNTTSSTSEPNILTQVLVPASLDCWASPLIGLAAFASPPHLYPWTPAIPTQQSSQLCSHPPVSLKRKPDHLFRSRLRLNDPAMQLAVHHQRKHTTLAIVASVHNECGGASPCWNREKCKGGGSMAPRKDYRDHEDLPQQQRGFGEKAGREAYLKFNHRIVFTHIIRQGGNLHPVFDDPLPQGSPTCHSSPLRAIGIHPLPSTIKPQPSLLIFPRFSMHQFLGGPTFRRIVLRPAGRI